MYQYNLNVYINTVHVSLPNEKLRIIIIIIIVRMNLHNKRIFKSYFARYSVYIYIYNNII